MARDPMCNYVTKVPVYNHVEGPSVLPCNQGLSEKPRRKSQSQGRRFHGLTMPKSQCVTKLWNAQCVAKEPMCNYIEGSKVPVCNYAEITEL